MTGVEKNKPTLISLKEENMRKIFAITGMLMVFSLVLAACGGAAPAPSGDPITVKETVIVTVQVTAPPAAPPAAPPP